MSSYLVSGAGSTEYCGRYGKAGTLNGQPYYTEPGHYLYYDGTKWVLANGLTTSATIAYSAPAITGPWSVEEGEAPAPKVSPTYDTGDISRALKLRVRRRLGDVDGTMYTRQEIYMWLSEAIRDIVSRVPDMTIPAYCTTFHYTKSLNAGDYPGMVITAGKDYYDLPSDFLRERGLVWIPGGVAASSVWATRLSVEQVAAKEEVWEASDTEPYYYLWRGRIYLMVGGVAANDQFRLYYVRWPDDYIVNTDEGGEQFTTEGPYSLSDSVDPVIPRYFWRAMTDYAVARCLEARGAWDRARVLLDDYERSLIDVVGRYINNVLPADKVPSEGIGLGRTG